MQVFEPEPAQAPLPRKEGVYKEGLNGQMLYYPPPKPVDPAIFVDPEKTIRKNAAIVVANYGTPEASHAQSKIEAISNRMSQGYYGHGTDSEHYRLLLLIDEVLWTPLAEAGHIVRTPVPVTVEGGERQ